MKNILAVFCVLIFVSACASADQYQRADRTEYRVVVPTSRTEPQQWRYSLASPVGNWTRADYDDSGWSVGPAPFATEHTRGVEVGTEWNTDRIWLRRTVEIEDIDFSDLHIRLFHDEDVRVYVNGMLVFERTGFSNWYVERPVFDADKAFRVGENTIAVACRMTYGGQGIDVGFVDVVQDVRWSRAKAQQWYQQRPWPIGFNYVPRNAINYTEMWMDYTPWKEENPEIMEYSFDPELIDQEMALAEEIGFNTVRVVMPYVVWQCDPEGFKERLDTFLEICYQRGMKVTPIFFDDCAFGTFVDPWCGPQPDVIEGFYANAWSPSPGHSMVKDPSTWPKLKEYVQDIVRTHADDHRILYWDLYNEPHNFIGDGSIELVKKTFQWARQVNPSQPLTMGWWNNNDRLNEAMFSNSDIITFHSYGRAQQLEELIADLELHGRPQVCTEWLNRPVGSVAQTKLPVFKKYNVGALHWGLVNGRTQTHFPWGSHPDNPNFDPDPDPWQHDLFHPDLRPYDQTELDLFKNYIEQMNTDQ